MTRYYLRYVKEHQFLVIVDSNTRHTYNPILEHVVKTQPSSHDSMMCLGYTEISEPDAMKIVLQNGFNHYKEIQ